MAAGGRAIHRLSNGLGYVIEYGPDLTGRTGQRNRWELPSEGLQWMLPLMTRCADKGRPAALVTARNG